MRARRMTEWIGVLLVVVVAGLVAAPASAMAGTLSTASASDVLDQSATLTGSASGYSSNDYCSFIVVSDDPNFYEDTLVSGPYAAQPCSGTYSIHVADPSILIPGGRYYYAAVHCVNTQTQNGQTVCGSTYAYPNGWDQSDQCRPLVSSATKICPTFTMGLPSGTTESASSIAGTSATFNAQVQIQDVPANTVGVFFEYSTDPNLTAATDTHDFPLGSATNGVYDVSQSVTGLTPGTTYYYRVVVGTSETDQPPPRTANIVSFQTGGFVLTDAATSVTGTGATLNGEVDAGDTSLTYTWLYSTSSATTNGELSSGTTSVSGSTVPAGSDQLVNLPVTGLQPDTTYYFQVVTDQSSIYGQVMSFTTLPTGCPTGTSQLVNSVLGATGFDVSGCFSSAGGVYTGQGTVEIGGLTLSGPPTGTVTIDTVKDRITSSSGYSINAGAISLYGYKQGAIDASFKTTSSGGGYTSELSVGGVNEDAVIAGLALGGNLVIDASSLGGSTVKISALDLPSLLGGITADATLTLSQGASGSLGGSITAVHAQVGDSTIGPITLPGFTLDADLPNDSWTGEAELTLPLADKALKVKIGLLDGQFNELGLDYEGVDLPLGESGLAIDGIGFDTIFRPVSLKGEILLTSEAKIASFSLFTIKAEFEETYFQDHSLDDLPGEEGVTLRNVPVTIGVSGTLNLVSVIQLAQADFTYYGTPGGGLVGLTAKLGSPLETPCPAGGSLGVDPSLDIAGDASSHGFNIVGSGSATIDLCGVSFNASANAAISSTGFAVCGSILGNSDGIGGHWPSHFSSLSDLTSDLQAYPAGGCDVGNYEASIARATAPGGVQLPGGLPFAVIRVPGKGGPPQLTVTGPGGLRIVMPGRDRPAVAAHRYLAFADPANDTTYVELTRPQAGRYEVHTQAGSPAIAQVSVAHGQPAPRVTGRVTARGRLRLLTWRARAVPSQRLVFHEIGGAGDRILARTTKLRGSVLFRPAAGVAGRRTVIVYVYENGLLRSEQRIASFTGPTITKPRRPTHVVVRRGHGTLAIRWRGTGASTAHYLVSVITSDGRHQLFVARRTRLTVRGIPSTESAEVTVTGVNVLGVRGRSVTARVKRA